MSYNRKIEWLNNNRIIYRREPISDIPTIETDQYMFYENGTYEHYHLFNSKAKITTYRSLKWHFLVIHYLNYDGNPHPYAWFSKVARFIANKENGFVTFFIKSSLVEAMIIDVILQGDTPPKNKLRKVIFKIHSGLNLSEKLKIVGKLIGRSKLDKEQIYECMLDLNHMGKKITVSRIAGLLDCSARTIYRHMCNDLKHEKYMLNEEV